MLNFLKFVFLAINLAILFGADAYAQDQREWVDSSGKFKITGTFDRFEDGDVYIERDDGATIKIPYGSLSKPDQLYVDRQTNPNSNDGNAMEGGNPDRDDTNNTTNNVSDSPSGNETAEPSRVLDSVLQIEAPEKSNDLPNAKPSDFQSEIDFALIDPLPEKIKGLAIVLYRRPNTAEVGKAFSTLSQRPSLPPVLIQLIRECSQTGNHYLRNESLKLLAIFDPAKSFDRILDSLDDTSFDVRQTSLELIEYLKDERAVEHLIERFPGSDRAKISTVLARFGPDVEEAVFPLLQHKRRNVVADAILLLEKIGTQKSVDEITPLLEGHVMIRMQAQSSIEKIKKRLGQ